jgi:hypothetical protein
MPGGFVRLVPGRDARADVLVVLGWHLVVGVLGGVAWWLLADLPVYTATASGAHMSEVALSHRFDADGWFVVIAAVAGFVSGVVLTWWRSRDHRLTTVLLLVGSVVAAASHGVVGGVLGPPDPEPVLAGLAEGETVPVPLVVSADVAYLSWPIAVLAGALMVLWSSTRVGDRRFAEGLPGEPVPGADAGRGHAPWDEPFPERTPR